MINIGKLIETELHRQERTASWFAKKLYCDRTNVYSIFKRQSLDTDLLIRICYILNHDFFQYYSAELKDSPLLPVDNKNDSE
nr:XRE family transcriptional regulator [Bacteroides sp. OM08-17BH]